MNTSYKIAWAMRAGIWKSLFASAVIASTSHPVGAADITIDDLIGRWCGTESNYTFSRTDLQVARLDGQPLKHGPQLRIAKVEGTNSQLTVHWVPIRLGNSTSFELTDDRSRLIQWSQIVGDKQPELVFQRC
jgi:hypothetical protein